MSRIYYEGKFYTYPLRAFEALSNLGMLRSAAVHGELRCGRKAVPDHAR